MKIKVVSDGTGRGTMIVNAENGEPILTARKLEISVDANSLVVARLEFIGVELDLEAEVKEDVS